LIVFEVAIKKRNGCQTSFLHCVDFLDNRRAVTRHRIFATSNWIALAIPKNGFA
jgi:hypothetical protein